MDPFARGAATVVVTGFFLELRLIQILDCTALIMRGVREPRQ